MRIRKTCQQEIFNSHITDPVSFIKQAPEVFFANCRPAVTETMNQMILGATLFQKDYRSQTTISKKAGYKCRETINRALKILEQAGCIISNYRHKKTNEYKISSWFRDPYIRARLAPFLNAIKILPLFALLSLEEACPQNADVEQKVTQRIYEDLKVSYFNILKPSSTDRLTRVSSHATKKIIPTFLVRPILYGDPERGVSKKEKEKVMNATTESREVNPIPLAIRDITELPLTKWGQIKLSAFPEQAIQYARRELQNSKPNDPFAWFFGVCLKFCQKNKIAPNWKQMVELSSKYKMPDNALMLLASDNEYYPTNLNLKNPYPSTKYNNITQAVNKKTERGISESSSFSDVSRKKANDFIAQSRAQQQKVDQEDPYLAAKRLEESAHIVGAVYYGNPFINWLSKDEQKRLQQEVHGHCSCSLRIKETTESREFNSESREACSDNLMDISSQQTSNT